MPLDRHKTIRQALHYVDLHPQWPSENLEDRLNMPIWELCARNLFDHALYPDPKVVGSMNRSTRAQRIILDRLTGTRRMGTHPAVRNAKTLTILDLTQADTEEVGDDDDSDE